MRIPDRRHTELNEIRWWSHWAKLSWKGEGYVLSSDLIREGFFNRGGSLNCGSLLGTASWAEGKFARRGVVATMSAFESCEAVRALLRAGYRQVDEMAVLVSKGGVPDASSGSVAVSRNPRSWTWAYLRSFYGDTALSDAVGPLVMSLSKSRQVTLLESRVNGDTAGVAALFKTPGVAGVYCVGTVPEHRREGVATGLIARAREMSESEGRTMVLQTLKSDGVSGFYFKRGFEKIYSKLLLEKSSNDC